MIKTLTTLMGPDEVSTRVLAGELPLNLAIEKWERIELVKPPGDSLSLTAATCALCIVYTCATCPYTTHHGIHCGDLWLEVIRSEEYGRMTKKLKEIPR